MQRHIKKGLAAIPAQQVLVRINTLAAAWGVSVPLNLFEEVNQWIRVAGDPVRT